MRFSCWWILAGVASLVACAHRQVETAAAVRKAEKALSEYFPLAQGNSWIYSTEFQGQPQPDLEVRLEREEQGFWVDNRPVPSRYRIDAEGVRDGSHRYLLKLPLQKGTRWMSVADFRTVEHYEILADDKRVSLPAGEFSRCVVVRMEVRIDAQRVMRNQMTFAPGVGIVEVVTSLLDGQRESQQARLRLKSFRVQPSPQS